MTKLAIESLHSRLIKFVFNYRILFAYIMTMSYICLHYYVSKEDLAQQQQNINQLENKNYIIKKPSRFLLQQSHDYLYVLNKRNKIYSASDKSVILNTLKRNQRLIVDKSLNGKKYKRQSKLNELKFDYNHQMSYNLKNKTITFSSQILQDKILLHLLNTPSLNELNASTNGIFLEAGAYDGETWSNTLYLERFKNWTGLLIEPSTLNYNRLKSKTRNAYSINSCLSSGKLSIKSDYIEAGPFGITINASSQTAESSSIYSVICHPLEKILNDFYSQFSFFKYKKSRITQNLNMPTIDYMSLDIEGNEKSTVETFPWNKFRINFLSIEYNQNREVYHWLKAYLKGFGYMETLVDDVWFQDVYLAHESVYYKLNNSITNVSQFLKRNL